MPIELKKKKAFIYAKYVNDSILKAATDSYSGKMIITINLFEGGITECKISKDELITLAKIGTKD